MVSLVRLMLFTTTVGILTVRTGSVQSCHQTPIFPYRGRARQTNPHYGGVCSFKNFSPAQYAMERTGTVSVKRGLSTPPTHHGSVNWKKKKIQLDPKVNVYTSIKSIMNSVLHACVMPVHVLRPDQIDYMFHGSGGSNFVAHQKKI